ncbi:MAG: hypothetical protein H7641_11315 [Candidatus Heimdallarchaeota archaeon]|nr:hypothetical protein [Candidatus Heimdallarchaeota archaeon]MCK4878149.1 hypothetical protein [Candidatus Heimdallarchaeota archaeon]
MRIYHFLVLVVVLTAINFPLGSTSLIPSNVIQQNDNPVSTYALLFDQFPYVVGNETLCSSTEIRSSLIELGWQDENISLFLGEENITEEIFLEQLNYLEENVDDNDLVFVYITAHGHTYCRDVLDFNNWFQKEFNDIGTNNKVIFMETCFSGEFIKNFYGNLFAMSSVGEDSYAITYTPENDTWVLSEPPFVGGISSHFWAKTIKDVNADVSGDGVVSIEEMYEYSLPSIRECYNETFENNPSLAELIRFTAGFTDNYPIPTVVDNIYYELTLNATDYILNNEKYQWEDDIIAPVILNYDTIYFTEENETITVPFLVSDRSSIFYYCYVDSKLDKHGKVDGPYAELELLCKVNVESHEDYNVSLTVVDDWGNEKLDFTLIIFDGEEEASLSLWGLGFALIVVYCLSGKTRRRYKTT